MTTPQWLALEIIAGLTVFLLARTEAVRLGGFLMAVIALLYLAGVL
ncbi:hypothetical protein [Streptomyces sp. 049-1]